MKRFFVSAIAIACTMSGALAQTSPPAAAPSAPAQGNAAPVASSGGGKRVACQAAAQGMKGPERRDQMQLCLAQARLDCTKQAIDQKVDAPQRRDFVRNCVGAKPARGGSDKTDE
jgi:hypothetical protein